MEEDVLNEIGFTEPEKKVYITLLTLGTSKAAPILEKTGLQNSVFYRTIHRLMEKGFVSFIKRGKIKYYRAADPEFLLRYVKERERKIQGLIPHLKLRQKQALEKKEAEVYSGFKGVRTMFYTLIEDARKGENYYFFGTRAEIYEELQERIYLAHDEVRKEKGLNVFGIHHISVKSHMRKGRTLKNRYVDFPIPQTMSIFRDKVAIIAWGEHVEDPIGILITSKEIAEQYEQFFKEMWKVAKP